MKKRIVSLLIILGLAFLISGCKSHKKPTGIIDDDTLVSTTIEKPKSGSTFSNDPLDNVFISLSVFEKQPYFKSSSTGTAKAKVLGFNYTQKVYIDKQRTPEGTLLQQVSRSGLKKTAEQKMIFDDRAIIRSATKITNSSVSWENSSSEIVNFEKYKQMYGYLPKYYTGYILNKEMILDYDVLSNTKDEFSIYLNLDPIKSVNDYKIDIKTNGGLKDYPAFYYCHMTITMNSAWEVKTISIQEKYDMSLPGMGTFSCVTDSTDNYSYEKGSIKELAYYLPYLELEIPGGVTSEPSLPVVKDETYYLQSLVGCLTKNAVAGFNLNLTYDNLESSGKAFLNITDLSNLEAKLNIGSIDLTIKEGYLYIKSPIGNFKYNVGPLINQLINSEEDADVSEDSEETIKFTMDKNENQINLSALLLADLNAKVELSLEENDEITLNHIKLKIDDQDIITLIPTLEKGEIFYDNSLSYQNLENLNWLVEKVKLLSSSDAISMNLAYEKGSLKIGADYKSNKNLRVLSLNLMINDKNYPLYLVSENVGSKTEFYLEFLNVQAKVTADEINEYLEYLKTLFDEIPNSCDVKIFEQLQFDFLINSFVLNHDMLELMFTMMINNKEIELKLSASELTNGILIEEEKTGASLMVTTSDGTISLPIVLTDNVFEMADIRKYDYLIEDIVEMIYASAVNVSLSGDFSGIGLDINIQASCECINGAVIFNYNNNLINIDLSIHNGIVYGEIKNIKFKFLISEIPNFVKTIIDYVQKEFGVTINIDLDTILNKLNEIIMSSSTPKNVNNFAITDDEVGFNISIDNFNIKLQPLYDKINPTIIDLENALTIDDLYELLNYVTGVNAILKREYLHLDGTFVVEKDEMVDGVSTRRTAYTCPTIAYLSFKGNVIDSAYVKIVVTGDENAYFEMVYQNSVISFVYSSEVTLNNESLIDSTYTNGMRFSITTDELTSLIDELLKIKNEISPSNGSIDIINLILKLDIFGSIEQITVSENNLSISVAASSNFTFNLFQTNGEIDKVELAGLVIDSNIISFSLNNIIEVIDINSKLISNTLSLSGITGLVDSAYNTINQNELHITGSASALGIEVPLDVRVMLSPSFKVYIKLEIPYLIAVTNKKTDSYVYYVDGMLYIKRDLYKYVFLKGQQYDKTDYVKMTWEEFNANLVDNILYILNISDSIKKLCTSNNNSSSNKLAIDHLIKSYQMIDKNEYSVALNFSELSSVLNDFTCNIGLKAFNDLTYISKLSGSLKIVNYIDIKFNLSTYGFGTPVDFTIIPSDLASDENYK